MDRNRMFFYDRYFYSGRDQQNALQTIHVCNHLYCSFRVPIAMLPMISKFFGNRSRENREAM